MIATRERNVVITRALISGSSVNELADVYGLSATRISQIACSTVAKAESDFGECSFNRVSSIRELRKRKNEVGRLLKRYMKLHTITIKPADLMPISDVIMERVFSVCRASLDKYVCQRIVELSINKYGLDSAHKGIHDKALVEQACVELENRLIGICNRASSYTRR